MESRKHAGKVRKLDLFMAEINIFQGNCCTFESVQFSLDRSKNDFTACRILILGQKSIRFLTLTWKLNTHIAITLQVRTLFLFHKLQVI